MNTRTRITPDPTGSKTLAERIVITPPADESDPLANAEFPPLTDEEAKKLLALFSRAR